MKPAKRASFILLTLTILVLSTSLQHATRVQADPSTGSVNSWDGFISCDINGNKKGVFLPTDDVYIKGGWFPRRVGKDVSIYVMPNGLKIKDIKPEDKIAGPVGQKVNANGRLPITKIWDHTLDTGKYDVWVDVNQNGKFDDGDLLHFYFFLARFYLFMVVPEYLIGSIGSVSAMILGLTIFRLSRSRKTK